MFFSRLRSVDLESAMFSSRGEAAAGIGTEEDVLMNWPNSLAPAEDEEGHRLKHNGPDLLYRVCQ